MSENKQKDVLPLLVILESIGKVQLYTKGFSEAADFFWAEEQLRFNATLMLLTNIGEYCGRVSTQLKDEYRTVSWKQVKGLRNRIAHDYTGIDYEVVFHILQHDLPDLKSELENIIKKELQKGVFDKGECEAARQSIFYKHVDFHHFL